jgi:hypothetical protein
MTCINKEFQDNYEKPEVCTTIYSLSAAYNPEDCICVEHKCINKNKERIGGDRDEQGCLGAAGYTYDQEVRACLRSWELNDNQKKAAKIAVAPLSYPVTIIKVDVLRCPGCFIVTLQRNDNQEQLKVNLENYEIVNEQQSMSPLKCTDLGGRTVNIVGGETCEDNEKNIGEVVGFISPNICCLEITGKIKQKNTPTEEKSDTFSLNQISFYNDILSISVSYSGGCQDHSFELIWNEQFFESSAVQADLFLIHNNNDDVCEAYITEKLNFDISELINNYIDSYQNRDSFIINVHDSEKNRHRVQYFFKSK